MTEQELEAEISSLEAQITEHVDDEFKGELQAMRDDLDRMLCQARARRQEHETIIAGHQRQIARYKRISLALDGVIMGWLIAFFTCSVIVGSAINATVNGTLIVLNLWRIRVMRNQDKKIQQDDAAREAKRRPT